MKPNMGNLDKGMRVLLAILIVVLYLTNMISGTLAVILLVFAAMFVVTSFIGFCPLYAPFRISTRKKEG